MSFRVTITVLLLNTYLLLLVGVNAASRNVQKGKDLSSNPRIFESER